MRNHSLCKGFFSFLWAESLKWSSRDLAFAKALLDIFKLVDDEKRSEIRLALKHISDDILIFT